MQRRDEFGGSSSSSDASDEEDGGWLAQSQFDIRLEHSEDTAGRPSVRERRPLSEAGVDVSPMLAGGRKLLILYPRAPSHHRQQTARLTIPFQPKMMT
jgi:hypothetical protein